MMGEQGAMVLFLLPGNSTDRLIQSVNLSAVGCNVKDIVDCLGGSVPSTGGLPEASHCGAVLGHQM
jgi:hypothetical protein